jgi:hypothetical protein
MQPQIALTIILLVLLVLLAIGYDRARKRYKAIKDTETTKIGNLPNGIVEVKAKISAPIPLRSPLHQSNCVWYCIHIEEHVRRKNNSHWKTRVKDHSQSSCILDDGTGKCLLDVTHLEFEFINKLVGTSGSFDDPSPEEQALLQKYNIDATTFLGTNKKMRYTEYMLTEGEEVYVLGQSEPTNHEYQRVIRGTAQEPVFLSNLSEETLLERYKSKQNLCLFGGVAIMFVFFVLQFVMY